MIHWDCFFDWLNKWQTLIAGILALAAAIWALRPVYKQLALARAQNDAVPREKVGEMILQLDSHAAEVFSIMSKRMVDLNNNLGWYEVHEKDYKFDEWCGEQQQEFMHAGMELKTAFARSHDVEVVEARKADLLAAVEALNGVLWEIHAPEYFSRFEEECSWTDEERQAANARSNQAAGEVEDYATKTSAAFRHLNEAFAEQRRSLVSRLRVIDDRLLA